MTKRAPLHLSRRGLIQMGAFPSALPLLPSDFDLWSGELARVFADLEATPEVEEAHRDRLLDRWHELERRILETPGSMPSAARAKADLLWRLLAMERHENAAAMADVRDFVLRRA